MQAAGSFWRLVALPTLGFAATLGWTGGEGLPGTDAVRGAPAATAPDGDWGTIREWVTQAICRSSSDNQPTISRQPLAERPAASQRALRHREVQWPLH